MAFTSPGLVKAANDALTGIQKDINIATLFATDFSPDAAEYCDTIKVPIISASANDVALTGSSINDFETDSAAIGYSDVKLSNHPKATLAAPKTADLEAPNAPYWPRATRAMVEAIQASISKKLGGLFTKEACTGGNIMFGSVTVQNIASLAGKCIGRAADTVLALSPEHYVALLALLDSSVYGNSNPVQSGKIDGLYGFRAVICMHDLPAGVHGVLIPRDAVAVAARGSIRSDEGFIEAGTVSDENGFPITLTRHFSGAKRMMFINADVLWGSALVQPTKVQSITFNSDLEG